MHPTLALTLSACAATDAGSNGSSNGTIEWSSGGSFGGGHGGWIKADDSSASWVMPPFGKSKQTQKQLEAGTFDKALQWLRANRLKSSQIDNAPACVDYGTDLVRYTGPGGDHLQFRLSRQPCPAVAETPS